jgi:glucose-1-phosphate cytidylyltransferase
MKVVILCGGMGTRMAEFTKTIPKPMVTILGVPIFKHIISIYSSYGFTEFHLALGYKSEVFLKYFFSNNILQGKINEFYKNNVVLKDIILKSKRLKIYLHNTGKNTLTGGRLKKLSSFLTKTFFLTYGDGLANVNIKKLLHHHKLNKKLVTITAVRPPARFGVLDIKGSRVSKFIEKPQVSEGWINGGFFVVEPGFLKFIKDDFTILEKEPLEKIARIRQLNAFKHKSFWQCIDTKRERDVIEDLAKNNGALWLRRKY